MNLNMFLLVQLQVRKQRNYESDLNMIMGM